MTLRFRKKRRGGIKMFDLSRWPSIRGIALSGDLQSDVFWFQTANGKRRLIVWPSGTQVEKSPLASGWIYPWPQPPHGCTTYRTFCSRPICSTMRLIGVGQLTVPNADIPSSCISACRRYWRRSSLASRTALFYRLSSAALRYIDFVLENDRFLCPHPWLVEAKSWLEQGG